MSHELEMIDGKAQMVYTGKEKPWHGLGTEIPSDLSPEAVMKIAGLDWTVEKHPLFAEINGQKIKTKSQALVRSSDQKILSIVTDSWNPVQNSEAFDFFSEFIHAGDMEMNTAGSLYGGRNVWALAKMKDSFFDIFKGDVTEGYLLFSNPHQFGKAIDIRFVAERVVCQNTLTMALGEMSSNAVRMSHRNEFDASKVKEMMGIATDKLAKYKEMATFLGSKQYTKETVVDYFNRIFPMTTDKKKVEGELASRASKKVYELLETQPGAEYAPNSWWQALNAVTFYNTHEVGRNQENRLNSQWFGGSKDRNIQALNLAVKMAEMA